MRRLVLLPLLGLLVACATPCRSSDTADRAQLVAKIEQFNSAIRDGDRQRYGDVFVEDFVFTWSRDGQIYDRAKILPNVVPTPDYDPIVDELLVRIYGDAAVVNFRVRKNAEDAGARVTFSYGKIDGAWKVLASHSTTIVTGTEQAEDAE